MKTQKIFNFIISMGLALLACTCLLMLVTSKLDTYQTCFVIGTMFASVIIGTLLSKTI